MYATTLPSSLVRTNHYLRRCAERGIPADACDVLYRHGRSLPGRSPSEVIYWLDRLTALRAANVGLDLWRYEHVAVVVFDDHRALTTYRGDEAYVRNRWSEARR
jgi:hypothetical protein